MADNRLELAVKLAEMNGAPIPKCKNCNHEICIHCGNWCDIIAHNEEQVTEYGVNCVDIGTKEYKQVYPILCCNGGCEI